MNFAKLIVETGTVCYIGTSIAVMGRSARIHRLACVGRGGVSRNEADRRLIMTHFEWRHGELRRMSAVARLTTCRRQLAAKLDLADAD